MQEASTSYKEIWLVVLTSDSNHPLEEICVQ